MVTVLWFSHVGDFQFLGSPSEPGLASVLALSGETSLRESLQLV